jgi:hypothetical protein
MFDAGESLRARAMAHGARRFSMGADPLCAGKQEGIALVRTAECLWKSSGCVKMLGSSQADRSLPVL